MTPAYANLAHHALVFLIGRHESILLGVSSPSSISLGRHSFFEIMQEPMLPCLAAQFEY